MIGVTRGGGELALAERRQLQRGGVQRRVEGVGELVQGARQLAPVAGLALLRNALREIAVAGGMHHGRHFALRAYFVGAVGPFGDTPENLTVVVRDGSDHHIGDELPIPEAHGAGLAGRTFIRIRGRQHFVQRAIEQRGTGLNTVHQCLRRRIGVDDAAFGIRDRDMRGREIQSRTHAEGTDRRRGGGFGRIAPFDQLLAQLAHGAHQLAAFIGTIGMTHVLVVARGQAPCRGGRVSHRLDHRALDGTEGPQRCQRRDHGEHRGDAKRDPEIAATRGEHVGE